MYAGANELLCISAASVAVFIRPVFWTRKSTYLSFILCYWVRALCWAVTASFNALRFDYCCCQIWKSKTTWVWRSRYGALITVMRETINHMLSWETVIFFLYTIAIFLSILMCGWITWKITLSLRQLTPMASFWCLYC